jgi:hypothetical protein
MARQQGHDGWYNQPSMWQEGYYRATKEILQRVEDLLHDEPCDCYGCRALVKAVAAIIECPHVWNWYENEDTGNKPRWYCIRCGKDKP